mmetsp:Transcript_59873/g.117438  ORF Transcript_59873/g.117438 Transcript_59873/m.117438 type:complete len:602 (+) Transcript_59873:129-1934(+)
MAIRHGSSLLAGNDDDALTVTRVPLGSIFNSERDYCFTTRSNIRSYEWTTAEAEELFDDLWNAAFREEVQEFELNSIIIMPRAWDKKEYGKGNIYDVHDGQQRLVTLSLLFAALRDYFQHLISKQGSASEQQVSEQVLDLGKMLKPDKVRKGEIFRIQLREKDNHVLKNILESISPELPKLSNSRLSSTECCIIENYEHFANACSEQLTPESANTFYDYLVENVYLLVSVPRSTRIARSLIMGQGKGKNTELVDEFKAVVCFGNVDDEKDQDAALEEWNTLSDEVGRDLLQSTCLLLAQGKLRKQARRNFEVDLFEEYIKAELADNKYDGKRFLQCKLKSACLALQNLKDGAMQPTHVAAVAGPCPGLNFLYSAGELSTSKEIQIVLLAVLMKIADNEPLFTAEELLKRLERVAVWMVLAKPKIQQRLHRCFNIIKCLDEPDELDKALKLTFDEKKQIRTELDTNPFGSKPAGRKVLTAILARLNGHELSRTSECRIIPFTSTLHLEHVLPQKSDTESWREEWQCPAEREEWLHRLGNLALLNGKVNSKISNGSFASKQRHLLDSPYPLTKRIGKSPKWDREEVEINHRELMDLAIDVWGL